jgi:hypothetical protein
VDSGARAGVPMLVTVSRCRSPAVYDCYSATYHSFKWRGSSRVVLCWPMSAWMLDYPHAGQPCWTALTWHRMIAVPRAAKLARERRLYRGSRYQHRGEAFLDRRGGRG